MAEFDVLIKGGTVVDGTRVPRYRADVGIRDGKIAQIGYLSNRSATQVIDAAGLIVAPGAIDLHTHYDAQLHWDPYCTIGSWHGVTTCTIGNCGFGFAPVRPRDVERAMLALSRNEAIPIEPMKRSMQVDWETFPQYMQRLAHLPLGINIGQLFPVAPAVAYVMGGFDDAKKRFPSEQETAVIIGHLHEAMEAGALGWSTQRLVPEGRASVQRDYDGTPMITDILPEEFYFALARALGDRGDGIIQLTQSGATDARFSTEEDFRFLEKLAMESGRPLLYNAILVSEKHPESHRAQLRWVEEANARGARVFGQAVTAAPPMRMTLEDWNLFDSIPVWREATLGTVVEKKAKLSDPDRRKLMREDYDENGFDTINVTVGIDFDHFIARKVHKEDLKEKYAGLSVVQIAEREQKHVIDAMLDLSVADDLRTEWSSASGTPDVQGYRELMDSPYTLPGISDGGAHLKFNTPATYPTEMLSWLVRDAEVLSLEEAHFRLSGLCAWAAGIEDRGTLRPGQAADIVVYDLEELETLPQEVVHDLPAGEWRRVQGAKGYRQIMVNGVVIFADGNCTAAVPGKLLCHGRATY